MKIEWNPEMEPRHDVTVIDKVEWDRVILCGYMDIVVSINKLIENWKMIWWKLKNSAERFKMYFSLCSLDSVEHKDKIDLSCSSQERMEGRDYTAKWLLENNKGSLKHWLEYNVWNHIREG